MLYKGGFFVGETWSGSSQGEEKQNGDPTLQTVIYSGFLG